MSTLKVLIVDDHAVVRTGLRLLLDTQPDMETVGEAGNVDEAIAETRALDPDLVLLDLTMPGKPGLTAMPELLREHPDLKVMILSMEDDPRYVREAFAAGARGYLLKEAVANEVVGAIREVAAGGRYVHPELGARLIDTEPSAESPHDDPLSEREREVLTLLALGHTNHEIAKQLFISVRTAEAHRAHIMKKLNLATRAELVRYAIANGLYKTSRTRRVWLRPATPHGRAEPVSVEPDGQSRRETPEGDVDLARRQEPRGALGAGRPREREAGALDLDAGQPGRPVADDRRAAGCRVEHDRRAPGCERGDPVLQVERARIGCHRPVVDALAGREVEHLEAVSGESDQLVALERDRAGLADIERPQRLARRRRAKGRRPVRPEHGNPPAVDRDARSSGSGRDRHGPVATVHRRDGRAAVHAVAKTSVAPSPASARTEAARANRPSTHSWQSGEPAISRARAVLRHQPFGAEPADRDRRDLHAVGAHHAGDPRRGADPLGRPPGDVPVENPVAAPLVVADRDGDARAVHRDRPDRAACDERPRRPGDDLA